jgi:6-phosphogluconate dehydrogenase
MALLFAEHGIHALLNDPSEDTVNQLLETARKDGVESKFEKYLDYGELCQNLDSPKVFVFSLAHGDSRRQRSRWLASLS